MTFFKQHLSQVLTLSDRLEFLNMWYILIIINDVLTIAGSVFKLRIENKASVVGTVIPILFARYALLFAVPAWVFTGCYLDRWYPLIFKYLHIFNPCPAELLISFLIHLKIELLMQYLALNDTICIAIRKLLLLNFWLPQIISFYFNPQNTIKKIHQIIDLKLWVALTQVSENYSFV